MPADNMGNRCTTPIFSRLPKIYNKKRPLLKRFKGALFLVQSDCLIF